MPGATDFAWTPSGDYDRNSNIRRFMDRHGIKTYHELVKRSTDDIEWFWGAVEKNLAFEWYHPYTKVLDTSKGIEWAKWFVGGKTNIALNCVDRHARSWRRNKVALIYEGEDGKVRRFTYRDLHIETGRLAALLKSLGLGRGDAVGVFMPMLPETVAALLACAKLGAIFVPVFSGFGAPAISTRLSDCGAKVLITADGFTRRGKVVEMKRVADEAASSCSALKHLVVFKNLSNAIPWTEGRDIDWAETKKLKPLPGSEPMDSEDVFMVIYTSGTTGKPKGAVHVHGGLMVKLAQEVAHQADLREEDILYWFSDMGWIMGPWEVVGGLALGGTLFLYPGAPDHPAPDRLWAMIERHGITTLGISPTLIRALMRYGDGPVKAHDLSSLRILASTGETWNPDPWMWFFENVGGGRCPIINLSGGTEVGACFLSPLPVTPLRPCTLGGPALGVCVDVVDAECRPVRGEVGELVARKPWPGMTRGLWKDPERYLKTYWSRWKGVWWHGDFASVDADGYWYLHGRSDDTIKIAGKRLGPTEVESILVSHPAVAESAAVGIPHEVKGESLWCFAILRPGHEGTARLAEELKVMVGKELGKAYRPEEVRFVRELPKTRNAKILRRAIRAVVAGEPAGDLSNLENPGALEEIRAQGVARR